MPRYGARLRQSDCTKSRFAARPISTAVALHMSTTDLTQIHELHRYALLEPNTQQTCKYNYLPKNGMYATFQGFRHRPGRAERNHEKSPTGQNKYTVCLRRERTPAVVATLSSLNKILSVKGGWQMNLTIRQFRARFWPSRICVVYRRQQVSVHHAGSC